MSEAAYNPEHPENMPEIHREIVMIRGALDGVGRRWDELCQQLSSLRMQRPEAPSDKLSVAAERWDVYSPLGKQLREIYDEVSSMETRISSLAGEIGL